MKVTGEKLEALVDAYLDAHVETVRANLERETTVRYCKPEAERTAALEKMLAAHNKRAAAFRALAAARGKKLRPTRARSL